MATLLTSRIVAAAGAAICAALAWREFRSVRAEAVYTEGIGAPTDAPARDTPGRLERYLEARALDPGEPLYALRCGQILQTRASALRGPERTAMLNDALGHFEASLAIAPLDPRAQAEAGRALDGLGRSEESAARLDAALVVGRRHPSALETVARHSARRFAQSRDPSDLRRGLLAAREGLEIRDRPAPGAENHGSAPGTGSMRQLLSQTAGPGTDELILATGGDPALLLTAAALMPDSRAAERERVLAEAARLGAERTQ